MPARPDLDIHNIALMEELLKAETEELKNIITACTRYRHKQNNMQNWIALIEKKYRYYRTITKAIRYQ